MNEVSDQLSGPLPSRPSSANLLQQAQLAGGMRLKKWAETIGISKMTAWRWRKAGKIKVIWRYGIPWVTAETIQNFFTDDGTGPRRPKRRRPPRSKVGSTVSSGSTERRSNY